MYYKKIGDQVNNGLSPSQKASFACLTTTCRLFGMQTQGLCGCGEGSKKGHSRPILAGISVIGLTTNILKLFKHSQNGNVA